MEEASRKELFSRSSSWGPGAAVGILLWILATWESTWAGVLPRPSREVLLRFQQVQETIAQGRIAEAIPILEKILCGTEDGYVSIEALGGVHLPIKRAAALLVESLTPEGQATFEAWCAGKAARRLDEALAHRDRDALARIVWEYPTTSFAAESALVLAADAWDRKQFAESLRWAQKVLETPACPKNLKPQALLVLAADELLTGRADQAQQTLQQLASLVPASTLQLGSAAGLSPSLRERMMDLMAEAALAAGKETVPSVGKEAVPSVATGRAFAAEKGGELPSGSWPMFRGNPARNASTHWTGLVGDIRWHLEMESLEAFRTAGPGPTPHARGVRFFPPGIFPAAHPVVVGSFCLVRLPTRLVALDLASGRQVWEYPWGGELSSSQSPAFGPAGPIFIGGLSPQGSTQRLFEDAPYGQIVVSGDRLYLVDGLGPASSVPFPVIRGGGNPGGSSPVPPASNRLVALDLRKEGKVLWSVGSSSGEDEPALRDTFFLGPPLPIQGRLYVLAEQGVEIRLMALAETTGQLLWSLPIAVPERNILSDPARRLAGAMASYADGVLVCPSSAGAIVAVDPWTRNILWAYEVPLSESSPHSVRAQLLRALGGVRIPQENLQNLHCSCDSTVALANGYGVVAPVESDQLLCLELQSGRLCWQRQLEDFRYVAAIVEEVVCVVGSRSVSGWNLRNGKPAWDELALPLPEKAQTAGWGFRVGRSYYLPISGSALLQIDLLTGRIEHCYSLPKQPGNVIGVGSMLISLSSEGVDAFGPPTH